MILYHYCSNEAFMSIVKSRSIWLSSLSLSNDSMEGKWLRNIFSSICTDEKLNEHLKKQVMEQFSILENLIDGLGFCLSEYGDMLSQWRGYASDGAGVCVGFPKKYFEKLAEADADQQDQLPRIIEVEYDLEEQKKITAPTYGEVKKLIDEGAFNFVGRRMLLDSRTDEEIAKADKKQKEAFYKLAARVLVHFPDLYRLKNPAFREEKEWRLISYLVKNTDDQFEIRPSFDRIIPYRKFDVPESENGPISQVILGPKNITPVYLVEAMLKQRGYTHATVRQSTSSYR